MQVVCVRDYPTSARRGSQGATALWSPDLKISLVPLLLREMGERERGGGNISARHIDCLPEFFPHLPGGDATSPFYRWEG